MRLNYTEPSVSSWKERADQVLPGGVLGTSLVPSEAQFVPVSGRGSHVLSASGTEYIDYTMGSGALLFGYQPPAVMEALRSQAENLIHVYAYLNTPAIELAEEIVDAVPSAEMMRFTASGGEATLYAMRLARAHTGRDKILKFEGAYHGFHDYAIHSFNAGNGGLYPQPRPNSSGIPDDVIQQVLVAPFNDIEKTAEIIRANAQDLAAIIVEPVQRAIEPLPGFLAELRKLADETGACLIFDEVVTGFRFGYGGAQERFGVFPDLTTLGKVIGGGLPLAAVCGQRDIVERCAPGGDNGYVYQSGTMNGHALAAACGGATLKVLREDPPYKKLAALGDSLRTGIAELLEQHGARAQVIGTDSLWQVVFTDRPITQVEDIWQSDLSRAREFQRGLIEREVMVWVGNRSFLSTAHTPDDVERTLEAVDDTLRNMDL